MITKMEQEAAQAPFVVEKQLAENLEVLKKLCRKLYKLNPPFVITIGRGSSDHACLYAKYLFEIIFGIPTVSAAPSVFTLYGSNFNAKNALAIAISQSGQSPDICEVMESIKKKGGLTVAIVNKEKSPLANIAEYTIPMLAGPEKAVAATKTYIASLFALAHLVTMLSKNKRYLANLQMLVDGLHDALNMDWSKAISIFKKINDTLVIGRGYGFAIAQEAALKFKETSNIHAEAFSGAEILHGPFALMKKNHPYLLFTQGDESLPGLIGLAKKISSVGGKPFMSIPADVIPSLRKINIGATFLPIPKYINPICDPIMTIQSFYLMIARLAVARGYNPDKPANLRKVTETF